MVSDAELSSGLSRDYTACANMDQRIIVVIQFRRVERGHQYYNTTLLWIWRILSQRVNLSRMVSNRLTGRLHIKALRTAPGVFVDAPGSIWPGSAEGLHVATSHLRPHCWHLEGPPRNCRPCLPAVPAHQACVIGAEAIIGHIPCRIQAATTDLCVTAAITLLLLVVI